MPNLDVNAWKIESLLIAFIGNQWTAFKPLCPDGIRYEGIGTACGVKGTQVFIFQPLCCVGDTLLALKC